mgnify:CR=1 FL=1
MYRGDSAMTQLGPTIVFTLMMQSFRAKLKKVFSFDLDCPATHAGMDFLEYKSGGRYNFPKNHKVELI